MGLFETAQKKAAKQTKSKKDEKPVFLPSEIMTPSKAESFLKNLREFLDISKKMDALEALKNSYYSGVSEPAKEAWFKMYQESSINPGTIIIGDGDNRIMFAPLDKYKKLTTESAEELLGKYPNSPHPVVEVETTYSFNPDLIKKYGKHIEKLIENSKVISKEDKENLIVAKTETIVPKGTINLLSKIGTVDEVFEDVGASIQLKRVGEKA